MNFLKKEKNIRYTRDKKKKIELLNIKNIAII